MSRPRLHALPVLLGLCALSTALGCGSERPARHVVLITLDTLRADHLSLYGYSRPTSPNLERLARQSTVYTRAVASASWTVPSHASMFTGLDPSEHGAVSFLPDGKDAWNVHVLGLEYFTLAEALSAAGYRTAAFVANYGFLSRRQQLDQGFDVYEAAFRHGPALNARVFEWLVPNRDTPFFLFVNYIDTHGPLNDAPRPGFLDPPAPRGSGFAGDLYARVVREGRPADPELLRIVTDQYDTAIANVDEAVGDLAARLVEYGLWDDTLFIVTSDHGDFLGEHGLVGHAKDVYQEVLRVPLLVHHPGQKRGRRVDRVVSLVGLPNLIVTSLPEPWSERLATVFPRALGGEPAIAENRYARIGDLTDPRSAERFRRIRRTIYDWPWKYIESSDGHNELYDLSRDPGEATNRIAEEPERAARLAARLAERTPAEAAKGTPAQPAPEDIEALRALGYVE